MSGICSKCIEGCRGSCEIWLSSFRGREVLYPGPYGEMTAGADKDYQIEWDTKGKEPNVYYRANIVVSLDGEVIEEKEGVGFRILEGGIEEATSEKKSANVWIGIIVIAVILLIGFIALYLIIKKL